MKFRVRNQNQIRYSIVMMLVCVGACQPPGPGGGQQSTSDRSVTSAPFEEGEFWILSSDTTTGQSGLSYLTISGTGNVVSSIEVVTDVFTSAGCSIQSPESAFGGILLDPSSPSSIEFEFDGASMSVSASSQGDELTEGCSVEFTAAVAGSGTEQVLLPFNVFDISIQGTALVAGEPVRFAPLQLNRVRTPLPIACEESPTTLVGLLWAIGNQDPTAFFPSPTAAEATVVNIYGFDETISSVDLVVGGRAGCIGSTGTFSFDGTNLSFTSSFPASVPLPSDPNCNDDCVLAFNGQCDDGRESAATGDCLPGSDCADCGPSDNLPPPAEQSGGDGANGGAPEVEPPTCSITFSGRVAECGVFLASFLGFSTTKEVLRIEGVGSFADEETSGELTTVYLSIDRDGVEP